jgi:hypothetical protein
MERARLLYGNCFVNLLHAVRNSPPPQDPQERQPIMLRVKLLPLSRLLYKFTHLELSSSSFFFTTVRVQYLNICFSTKYFECLKLLFNLTSIFFPRLMHRTKKFKIFNVWIFYSLFLSAAGSATYGRSQRTEEYNLPEYDATFRRNIPPSISG